LMFLVQVETSESAIGVITENKLDDVIVQDPNGLEGMQIVFESKKDPLQRRHELLIKSELAEVMPVPIL
jgi:pumilio homology domain family member 6